MLSLLRLGSKQNNSWNPFRIRMFFFLTYSFGTETINTFIHSRSSLKNHTRFQTKMGKMYTRFQTKTAQKLTRWAALTYKTFIREYLRGSTTQQLDQLDQLFSSMSVFSPDFPTSRHLVILGTFQRFCFLFVWLEAQFQKRIGSSALTVFFDDSLEPGCYYWNVALDILASVLQTKKKTREKKI